MEIESWLLADANGLAQFLDISPALVPDVPDAVEQPKELIVSLARRSKRKEIREDLVPLLGDIRKVGAAYNSRLVSFVEGQWNIERAALASPSLHKAIQRLRDAF